MKLQNNNTANSLIISNSPRLSRLIASLCLIILQSVLAPNSGAASIDLTILEINNSLFKVGLAGSDEKLFIPFPGGLVTFPGDIPRPGDIPGLPNLPITFNTVTAEQKIYFPEPEADLYNSVTFHNNGVSAFLKSLTIVSDVKFVPNHLIVNNTVIGTYPNNDTLRIAFFKDTIPGPNDEHVPDDASTACLLGLSAMGLFGLALRTSRRGAPQQ